LIQRVTECERQTDGQNSLHFNGHFPGGPGLAGIRMPLDFIGAKGDGGGGKAPVKMSPPTNQHPVFYRLDALPVTQPCQSIKGKRQMDRAAIG